MSSLLNFNFPLHSKSEIYTHYFEDKDLYYASNKCCFSVSDKGLHKLCYLPALFQS